MSVCVVSVMKKFQKKDASTINRTRVFNCDDEDTARTLIHQLLSSKSLEWANHIIDENWNGNCDIKLDISNGEEMTIASLKVETDEVITEETWDVADIAYLPEEIGQIEMFTIDDIPRVVDRYASM